MKKQTDLQKFAIACASGVLDAASKQVLSKELLNSVCVIEPFGALMTPLMHACANRQPKVTQLLLSAGADVAVTQSHPFKDEPQGRTALHYAARSGDEESVQLLIASRANVNALDLRGNLPIELACMNGHVTTVKLLLKAGSDVNPRYKGSESTPLNTAIRMRRDDGISFSVKHGKIVQLLLDAKANVRQAERSGAQPLHCAAHKADLDVASKLIERGSDVNARGYVGSTPLMGAIRSEHPDCVALVELLLKSGADPNIKNDRDEDAFFIAQRDLEDSNGAERKWFQRMLALMKRYSAKSQRTRTATSRR